MEKNIIIGGAGYIGTVLIDFDSLIYKKRFSIISFKKKKILSL